MPIYAYRCNACGYAKDVLQKMSDPLLTDCPECGMPEFKKQVTAAGFQLKGSGWYATDFKGGSGGTSKPPVTESMQNEASATSTNTSTTDTGSASTAAAPATVPAK